MTERRNAHISARPKERLRATFGFDGATVQDQASPPIELSIEPGYYARCIEAYLHADDDGTGLRVNLEYSEDPWNTVPGSRTWLPVFEVGTRLQLFAQQMEGPITRFASYPEPLDLVNDLSDPPKRVLIRCNVEASADVQGIAVLVLELRKDY